MPVKFMKTSVTTNNVKVRKSDAKVVCSILKRIERDSGIITPALVVEAARNKKSPLFKYFDWNDTAAAAKWREHQARLLICSVQVTIKDSGGNETSVRAFVNVSPSENEVDDVIGGRGYMSAERSGRSENYQQQVLRYAYQQLVGWRKRFGGFKEFFEVAEKIDAVKV